MFRRLDFVQVYIDDILEVSAKDEKHQRHFEQVFQSLSEYGVLIDLKECVLDFLGHRVSGFRIKPRTTKLNALISSQPKTAKQTVFRYNQLL